MNIVEREIKRIKNDPSNRTYWQKTFKEKQYRLQNKKKDMDNLIKEFIYDAPIGSVERIN